MPRPRFELAQYKYMLPRLQRLWTHLERQGGGFGCRWRKRLGWFAWSGLRPNLRWTVASSSTAWHSSRVAWAEIDKQKSTQRKNRGRLIRVALVGYTNVGKSTLMNLLAKSEVFAENKLFATLDTTVRKGHHRQFAFPPFRHGRVSSASSPPIWSTLSSLPLTKCARPTSCLHVVDISHPDFEEQSKSSIRPWPTSVLRASLPFLSSTKSTPTPMSRKTKTTLPPGQKKTSRWQNSCRRGWPSWRRYLRVHFSPRENQYRRTEGTRVQAGQGTARAEVSLQRLSLPTLRGRHSLAFRRCCRGFASWDGLKPFPKESPFHHYVGEGSSGPYVSIIH